MYYIGEWIKSILAVIILAGFIEMIIPNNEFKGVTKMVLGLLIMLFLIQPVLNIFKIPSIVVGTVPDLFEMNHQSNQFPTTTQIIKQGELVRNDLASALKKQRQSILEGQIKRKLEQIEGLQLMNVRTEVQEDQVTEVIIKAKLSQSETMRKGILLERSLTRRIKETIQLYCNVPKDRIEVTWDG